MAHLNGMAHNSASKMESEFSTGHPLISWRSVLGGFLITFLMMALLTSLGVAVGGKGLSGGTDLQSAGLFTGIWFVASCLLSLFTGSYFAVRVSKFHTFRIGAAQGVIIAALFFGVVLYQSVSALGWAGQKAESAVGNAGSALLTGVSSASDNSVVSRVVGQTMEDSLGALNLAPDRLQALATGLSTRLMRGDTTSAKNYLAAQTGVSPQEADQRIAQLKANVDKATAQVREATAQAMQGTGWSLFFTILLGSLAAIGGGALGSRTNVVKPLVVEEARHSSGAMPLPLPI